MPWFSFSSSLLHPGGYLRVIWRRFIPWQPLVPAEVDAAACALFAAQLHRSGKRGQLLALRGVALHWQDGGGDHTRG